MSAVRRSLLRGVALLSVVLLAACGEGDAPLRVGSAGSVPNASQAAGSDVPLLESATSDPFLASGEASVDAFRELLWSMPNWSTTRLAGAPPFDDVLASRAALVGQLESVRAAEPTASDVGEALGSAPYDVKMWELSAELLIRVSASSDAAGVAQGELVAVPLSLGLVPVTAGSAGDEQESLDAALGALAPVGSELLVVGGLDPATGEWLVPAEPGFERAPFLGALIALGADGQATSLDLRLAGESSAGWS
jgi:hypothetical protein